jgi:hypothetical protein
MKRIVLAVLLAGSCLPTAAADVCGSPGEKPNVKTVVVRLPSKPADPAFYYRMDLYLTVFVSQAEMKAFLDKLDPASASLPLIKDIREDMPLREDRDLFHYNFSDWWRLSPIESILTDFLRRGKASLVGIGGDSVERITIVDERAPAFTLARFYAGTKGINQFLVTRGCIAD